MVRRPFAESIKKRRMSRRRNSNITTMAGADEGFGYYSVVFVCTTIIVGILQTREWCL